MWAKLSITGTPHPIGAGMRAVAVIEDVTEREAARRRLAGERIEDLARYGEALGLAFHLALSVITVLGFVLSSQMGLSMACALLCVLAPNVQVLGGRVREMQVRVDLASLAARGITIDGFVESLRGENLNVSAGAVAEGKRFAGYRQEEATRLIGKPLTATVAPFPLADGLKAVAITRQTPYGQFGALISAAYSKRTVQEEGYEAVELLSASNDGGFCAPAGYAPQNPANNAVKGIDAANCGFGVPRTSNPAEYAEVMGKTDNFGGTVANPAAGSGAFAPRIPRYRRSQTDYERTGITSSFQWRPAPGTDINLDLMYGAFKNTRYDNYIGAISFGRSLAAANGKPVFNLRSEGRSFSNRCLAIADGFYEASEICTGEYAKACTEAGVS